MFNCICCGSKTYWSSDWDASDYGYDCEGIIGVYICSSCNTHIEVRDFIINGEEERSVKYYLPNYEDDIKYDFVNIDIGHCLYCKDTLEKVDKEVLIESDYDEEVIKVKKCTSCGSSYEIEDIFPLDDLYTYSDDFLDQYDLRTVFIK